MHNIFALILILRYLKMYNRFKMCISTFYILSCKSLTLIDLTQSATQRWPNVTVFSNFFFF